MEQDALFNYDRLERFAARADSLLSDKRLLKVFQESSRDKYVDDYIQSINIGIQEKAVIALLEFEDPSINRWLGKLGENISLSSELEIYIKEVLGRNNIRY